MTDKVKKALSYHYILAGTGLVLLALVWVYGWIFAPEGLYDPPAKGFRLLVLTALILLAWNLMSCVVSAGFFHAGSKHPADNFKAYQWASLRMVFFGVLFVFPVPLMTIALGSEVIGRVLALFIIVISMAAILFGRARIRMIGEKLKELDQPHFESPSLAPFEESTNLS